MILLGLRAKLTFAIVLLIVVFAGFFGLYFPAQQEHVANQALRSRTRSMARALSAISADWLSKPSAEINQLLAQFAQDADSDSDIAYIVIKRPDGTTLAGHGESRIPASLQSYLSLDLGDLGGIGDVGIGQSSDVHLLKENDDYIQVSTPIYQREVFAGTLTIGLSRYSVHTARGQSRTSALVVSALILLIGIAVSWLVGGGIATPLLAVAQELDAVSGTLAAAARDQEASAAQEAAAVAQTRRSMETLLDSAQQIADRSSEVLGNAERSTNGSQQIAQRIGNLNELSERVAEILGIIMQVADKADLLALNASLEGTRAGEAGKGFALVAAEMRRLAENVVESVAGIRELMKNMREASQAAVAASQEGTKSSTATTHSAREIALLTQEQRQATEQVMASMDEMGDILNHTLDGIQRTTTSASRLTELSGSLARMVNPSQVRFKADPDRPRKDGDAP